MKFQTSRFWEIEPADDKCISFPEGIIGFAEHKKFVLISQDAGSPFIWLQSLVDGKIAFLVINPFLFIPEYDPVVSKEDLKMLGLSEKNQAQVYAISIISEDPKEMTANLSAPIFINMEKHIGKQVVLYNSTYSTRHNILEEIKKISLETAVFAEEKNRLGYNIC